MKTYRTTLRKTHAVKATVPAAQLPLPPTLMTIREVAQTGLISEYTLRNLVRQGNVPMIKVGVKVLINYEMFCAQLNDPNRMYTGRVS